ncbi:oligosaccharide repeat unit polymerase family protein [Methanococcus vannielii]|nr:oligosaccharide repeat unit polymerase family protein [Methanococcus vannielii]
MKNFIDFKDLKVGPHHIFVILSSLFVLFSSVSGSTSLIVLFSSFFFYISFISGKKLLKNLEFKPYKIDFKKHYLFGIFLIFIGVLFTILDLLWVRGVPLFDPVSRKFLNVLYTALSHMLPLGFAIAISSSKLSLKRIVLYSVAFSALIMLLGYRTQVILLLLSTVFSLYYSKRIKNNALVYSFLVLFIVTFGLSFLRHSVLGIGGNPITSRISLTMSVLDVIVNNFTGTYEGIIHTSIFSSYGIIPGSRFGPRTLIANSIGITGVTITPTIFGAVLMDFGILGIIPYFGIFGLLLGISQKIGECLKGAYLGVYSIMAAYFLIGIETGILDFDVIMVYLLGAILSLNGIFKGILNVKK